ncbi:MAG: phosphatase PAP2 family protein [Magnetospirillum sp.]|nr:phosphatase PAP2 family protein [Magnetospirillum sp.]
MRRFDRRVLDLMERLLMAWEGLTLAAGEAWEAARPLRRMAAAQLARTRAWPLAWASVYVVLFGALSYAALDRPLAYFFKAHLSPHAEGFFKVVTELGRAEFYLVPAGLLAVGLWLASTRTLFPAARARLREMAARPAFLFLAVALSGLISNAVKFSLGRYRPRYLFENGTYGFNPFNTEWAMNSMPSGHSQAIFAAMTALVILLPRYDLLWLLIAGLVALSRVATTVHFLSDAVAGSFLAIVVTVLVARQFERRGIRLRLALRRDRRLGA